jgi:hypothetical protein
MGGVFFDVPAGTPPALAVGIGGFGGLFDLFAGLSEQVFGLAGVTAEVVIIVLLGLVNFLPRLLDQLLRSAHVSVAVADGYGRRLRIYDGTEDERGAEGDAKQQDSLRGHFVSPGYGRLRTQGSQANDTEGGL